MKEVANYQHLILTLEGFIVKSNDTLFSTKFLTWNSEEDLVTYFENIFPSIIDALQHQKVITFSAINSPSKNLPGIYDFIFSSKENKLNPYRPLVECWVIDRTDYYNDVKQYWQYHRQEAITTLATNN